MANLKLYLDSRRLKADGTALLKISVSYLRQVRYVSLGLSIRPEMWDSERGRVSDRHPSRLRLNNAIARMMLRAVFNFAIDEGLTTNYPFRRFHIKTVKTAKRSLSVEELRTLFSAEADPWQEPCLDFFRLSFMLVGINPIDLLHLTPASLHADRVEFNRSKTSRLYSLRLEPEARALVEKYRGAEHLLSFMDSRSDYLQFVRQCNHALKSIGCRCRKGQPREGKPLFPDLTTYWARHSWATVARSIGVSIDDIALSLGHGDGHDLTHIYLREDGSKVDEANRRVLDWVLYGKK